MLLRCFVCVFLWYPFTLWAQRPTISPGGVVNAASYTTTSDSGFSLAVVGKGIAPASIVSIFGSNLASATQSASATPLPTQLGGTVVTVNGVAAPLFYISPGQINFQNPGGQNALSIVVSTSGGTSDPYTLDAVAADFAIFTQDASGCGPGSVLNVGSDGNLTINSQFNSVSPGMVISLYGTGLGVVYNPPAIGSAAPTSPLAKAAEPSGPEFEFVASGGVDSNYWAGRAPGLVGVDQVNSQVPTTMREGCAVPVQVVAGGGLSQPVTISIRRGGGVCVDPPSAGFGDISWAKTITTTASTVSELDTLTASLQSSPGKQTPPLPVYIEGSSRGFETGLGASSCPVPGYRSLDGGVVSIQGPGLGATVAGNAPVTTGQVSGLSAYKVTLSSGTIGPGTYRVASTGGAEVGAFQSSLSIGSDIQISTILAGKTFSITSTPIAINWTGGAPNTWVTLTLVNHLGPYDIGIYTQAQAADGTLRLGGTPQFLGYTGPNWEIVVEVTPDPSSIPTFSASGLTLGGRHSWKYTHRFEGVVLQ